MPKNEPRPAVNGPKVTPNPGQIFEEPVDQESETATTPTDSAETPAQPDS
jgi:hypothetical protein